MNEVECIRCHINDPDEKNSTGRMIFVKDIDSLCGECHELSDEASHPTGMKPSLDIPEDFHLDWMGRVTCVTCHKAHYKKKDDFYPNLLRRQIKGRVFCNSCHRIIPGKDEELEHRLSIGIAHFEPKYYISDSKSMIDSVSRKCLGCHDGSIGQLADNNIVGIGDWQHGRSIGVSHPIGIDYERTASRNPDLNPEARLNPRIKLFEGKVGCGSCHNIFSEHPNYLVMKNKKSVLCLECHRK